MQNTKQTNKINETNTKNVNKPTINKGLGKGLGALLVGIDKIDADNIEENLTDNEKKLTYIKCIDIITNPYQPRKHFDEVSLQELADSIKQQGVIQPIVVQLTEQGKYQIIAGERRWRASKLANLDTIPAIIKKDLNNGTQALIALIENIQRDELNAIEEANAFVRLQQEFNLTHEQIAQQVGKSRSHISNLLRLLNLADQVQEMLAKGKIDMGHARALASLNPAGQLALANMIITHKWSVREVEKQVQNNANLYQTQSSSPSKVDISNNKKSKYDNINHDISLLEQDLSQTLNLAVHIQEKSKQAGQVLIKYNNLDELDNLINALKNLNLNK